MRPLSTDLRMRIVAAYHNNEGSYRVLAARFAVSPGVVGKFVRQQRDVGTLEPQVHRRGRKPLVRDEKEQQLRDHLEKSPDATLHERIEALDLDCSVKTMWKTLRRLGWRFKKSHRGQWNRTDQTSLGNAPIGDSVSGPSIHSGSCSSTKPD